MVRIFAFLRWAFLFAMATGIAGCASEPDFAQMPREPGRSVVQNTGQKPLQCVPYARDHSAIKIYGDAYTWWDQAAGKFSRGAQPQNGAVMVLTNYAGSQRGHVAVVRKIISPREIRVDHANWLDDGSIYLNDPVEDVSANNDWSRVRVYNIKTGGWGGNIYPVQGFIGGSGSDSFPDRDTAPLADPVDILQASMAKPAFKPLAKAAPRAVTRPAPTLPDEDLAPRSGAADAADPGGDAPLPHPDMVISANFPPGH